MQQMNIKVGKIQNVMKNVLSQLCHSAHVSYFFDYLESNLRCIDHGMVWSIAVVHSCLLAILIVLMLENVTNNADVR
jgi:hypothetical protein